jgi:hypothetical protein
MPCFWHAASSELHLGIGTDVFKFSVKVSEDCIVSTANRRSPKKLQKCLNRQSKQEW